MHGRWLALGVRPQLVQLRGEPQQQRAQSCPTLERIAAELAAEEQARRDDSTDVLARLSGYPTRDLPLAVGPQDGGPCMACRTDVPARTLVLRHSYHGPRPNLSEGAEGWLLCAACLALVPHKLLF
jgi:hypothetical protein